LFCTALFRAHLMRSVPGPDVLEQEGTGSKGLMPRAIAQVCAAALRVFSALRRSRFAPMDLTNNMCEQVFAELGCRQLAHWAVDVTYVQIYNEAFQDLLCPGTPAADISVIDQKRAPRYMQGSWQQQQDN